MRYSEKDIQNMVDRINNVKPNYLLDGALEAGN